MKLANNSPDSGYVCKGYFSDTKFGPKHQDAWVCANVETAADMRIVSRENKTFRPKANITRAEALAILMRSAGVLITAEVKIGQNDEPVSSLYSSRTPQWQIDMIESAEANDIIDVYGRGTPEKDFQPNKHATRADVFGIAYAILQYKYAEEETVVTSESILTPNANGTVTYTAGVGDFSLTLPNNSFIIEEESDMVYPISEQMTTAVGGTYTLQTNEVSFYVGRAECPYITCANYMPEFFASWKKIMEGMGFSVVDRGQYSVEIGHPTEGKGVFKFFEKDSTLYLVFVGGEVDTWELVKSNAQTVLDSFRVN